MTIEEPPPDQSINTTIQTIHEGPGQHIAPAPDPSPICEEFGIPWTDLPHAL